MMEAGLNGETLLVSRLKNKNGTIVVSMNNKVEFKKFEHQGWENAADKYEIAWSSLTRKFILPLLNSVGLKEGMRLLDLACGPGYVSESAKDLGASPVGIDFSARMIQLARNRNPGLEFIEGDAEHLNFEDNTFNAVTMNFGMLHMSEPEKVFSEAYRVLRKEGRVGFTVWAKPEESPAAKIVDDAINSYADLNTDIPEGPSAFLFCNPVECREMFIKAGFIPDTFSFSTFTVKWNVPTASFLFESELNGGVRTAALLARQTKITLDKIKVIIEKEVEIFKMGDVYSLPFSAHIISSAS